MSTILELGLWQFMFWWTVALIVGAWLWVLFADERRKLWVGEQIGWWLWHWYTGGPFDTTRTDHRVDWRDRVPYGLMRTTCVAGFVACLYVMSGYQTGPAMLAWVYGAAIALGLIPYLVAVTAVRAAVQMWWVTPIADAVRDLAKWDPEVKAHHIVKWQRIEGHWGLGLEVHVAPECPVRDTRLDEIVHAIRTRGGVDLGDVDHHWHLEGRDSYVEFLPAARLPELAPWTDPEDGTPNEPVRKLVRKQDPGVVWLGYGKDGASVTHDFDRYPHALISVGTGGGKSTMAKGIIAQLLAEDPQVECYNLDPKWHSQLWLRELPGVVNLHEAEDIHAALVGLVDEARQRNEASRDIPRRDFDAYIDSLPRKVILVEEMPTLMAWLKDWWQAQPDTKRGQPSPAVQALRELVNMSRVVRFNIIGLFQQATAIAAGGGLVRESLTLRILPAGFTKKTADMLAPEHDLEPLPDIDGRVMVIRGVRADECQFLFMTDDDAESFVAEGRGLLERAATWQKPQPAAPTPEGLAAANREVAAGLQTSGQENQAESVADATDNYDTNEMVTLTEAFDRKIIKAKSLRALQRAANPDRRGPNFPQPAAPGPRYLVSALVRWWDQLPRAATRREHYEPSVYFIVDGGEVREGLIVKIGKTTNIKERLDDFAAHPSEVVKLLVGPNPDMDWLVGEIGIHPAGVMRREDLVTEAQMSELEQTIHADWEAEVWDGKSLRCWSGKNAREKFRISPVRARRLRRDEVPA